MNRRSGFFIRHLPEIALLMAAFVWGITFPLGKYIVDRIPVFTYLAIRFFIASAMLLPLSRDGLRKSTRHELTVSLIIGVSLFVAFAFQTLGLKYTTAGKTAFANGLYVILVPFLYAAFFKAPLKKSAIVAGIFACVGVTMLGGDFSGLKDWDFGVTLVVISTLFTALQIVGIGRYAALINPMALTFIQVFSVAVCCAIVAFFTEIWPDNLNGALWLSIIFLALFATVFAYFIQCRVQKEISHTASAVIISMESVFGALLSWIFLKENFTVLMTVGCILLFVAMLIAQRDTVGDDSRPVADR